jgi:uncharacterized protein (UPF0332 family)
LATWRELSQDSLEAAKTLVSEGRLRSSISRSYYAAYCALTSDLVTRGIRFTHGWNNPAHQQLPDLAARNLVLPPSARRRVTKLIRLLRYAREDAVYRPGITVDRTLALNCLRDAIALMQDLGRR